MDSNHDLPGKKVMGHIAIAHREIKVERKGLETLTILIIRSLL